MARRRAEINAEAGRRKREILAEARHAKAAKSSDAEAKHSNKPKTPEDVLINKHPSTIRHETDPVKEANTRQKSGAVKEQRQARATTKTNDHVKTRYPAKAELTDEELEHPLMHEPQTPDATASDKSTIKLKQIEWSKKQGDS
jgi:hypothetical protein